MKRFKRSTGTVGSDGTDEAKPSRIVRNGKRYGCPSPVLLILLFLFLFLQSCRQNLPENIAFPYARIKYDPMAWKIDLDSIENSPSGRRQPAIATGTRIPSTIADLLDSSLEVKAEWKFVSPFLWLQSPGFEEEKAVWKAKQNRIAQDYLSRLSFKKDASPSPLLVWNDPAIESDETLFHKIYPVVCFGKNTDTLPLHLFYRETAFENGLNPVVLLPYMPEIGRYLPPPACFFESGGVLAVLGEPKRVIRHDSSRFFTKADSLRRLIRTDTAHSAYRRWVYREFLQDSTALKTLVATSLTIENPRFTAQQLTAAGHRLIADMYTTPDKLALLAAGPRNPQAESCIFQRGSLFEVAVFDFSEDSDCDALSWEKIPADCIRAGKQPALLTGTNYDKYFLAACFQDKNGRKTGTEPFLLIDTLSPTDVWKFILYHIAEEEALVSVRKNQDYSR